MSVINNPMFIYRMNQKATLHHPVHPFELTMDQ